MNFEWSQFERSQMPAGAKAIPTKIAKTEHRDVHKAVPRYLSDTYEWAYINPRSVRLLDRESVVATILWGQHRKLEQMVLDEVEPGSRVLQAACVYGDFSPVLARHIGEEGSLDIVDVAFAQVDRCAKKMREFSFVSVSRKDVLELGNDDYDAVCCYFLLHEMPDDYKHGFVDIALNSIGPDGKVIFIDYHKPHWANPLRPVMSLVFDTLEPFAKSLLRRNIRDLASAPEKFHWREDVFFGGLYQKVVVTPISSQE